MQIDDKTFFARAMDVNLYESIYFIIGRYYVILEHFDIAYREPYDEFLAKNIAKCLFRSVISLLYVCYKPPFMRIQLVCEH